MIDQLTTKFIEQIQYFIQMMFFTLIISVVTSGLMNGLRDMDHPGHKEYVTAIANLFILCMIMWWIAGRNLY